MRKLLLIPLLCFSLAAFCQTKQDTVINLKVPAGSTVNTTNKQLNPVLHEMLGNRVTNAGNASISNEIITFTGIRVKFGNSSEIGPLSGSDTITAPDADPLNFRVDYLVVNRNGTTSIITGQPGVQGLSPAFDVANQIPVYSILVNDRGVGTVTPVTYATLAEVRAGILTNVALSPNTYITVTQELIDEALTGLMTGHIIRYNNSDLPQRPTLQFEGAGVSVVDSVNKTRVIFSGGGGSSDTINIENGIGYSSIQQRKQGPGTVHLTNGGSTIVGTGTHFSDVVGVPTEVSYWGGFVIVDNGTPYIIQLGNYDSDTNVPVYKSINLDTGVETSGSFPGTTGDYSYYLVYNQAKGPATATIGGNYNISTTDNGVTLGGARNYSGAFGTVAIGGGNNRVLQDRGFIIGGLGNSNGGYDSGILGGTNNTIPDGSSNNFIIGSGGSNIDVSNTQTIILGGAYVSVPAGHSGETWVDQLSINSNPPDGDTTMRVLVWDGSDKRVKSITSGQLGGSGADSTVFETVYHASQNYIPYSGTPAGKYMGGTYNQDGDVWFQYQDPSDPTIQGYITSTVQGPVLFGQNRFASAGFLPQFLGTNSQNAQYLLYAQSANAGNTAMATKINIILEPSNGRIAVQGLAPGGGQATDFFGFEYGHQYLPFSLANGNSTYNRDIPDVEFVKDAIAAAGGGSGGDADSLGGQLPAYYLNRANHTGTQAWSTITSTPTTIGGYGITDAVPTSRTVNGHALSSNVTVTASDVGLGSVDNTSDAAKVVDIAGRAAKTYTQSSHGFVAGDVLKKSGGVWAKAQANSAANAEALGVVESVTTNTFRLVFAGEITLSGLTTETNYWLSSSTAGTTTTTEPTASGTVSKPVFYSISTTTAIVQIQRGIVN